MSASRSEDRVEQVLRHLADVARQATTTTYSDLSRAAGVRPLPLLFGVLKQIQRLAPEIGCDLSALVVRKSGIPGSGWGDADAWASERDRCYQTFSTEAAGGADVGGHRTADAGGGLQPQHEHQPNVDARGGTSRRTPSSGPSSPDNVGMLGRFRLLKEIGAGGFGRVYRAQHVDLGITRAVKIATDPEFVRQLRREGALLARLEHPRIVQVFDMDVEHDPPYILMEYVEGEDLRKRLEGGPLPLAEAAGIIVDVLEALSYAHHRGVIHRDIKPSNVLLDREGRAKVADFGVGRLTEKTTFHAAGDAFGTIAGVAGTAIYMSPEQKNPGLLGGGELDGRSDVYSAGLLLYEMLTGESPASARLPLPSEVRPEIPREFDDVFTRCAAGRREDRFASASDLADAILGAAGAGRTGPSGRGDDMKTPCLPPATAQAGEAWVSPTDGKEMVFVPRGEFVMGSPPGEGSSNEHPQRSVHLEGYWIDRTPVTNAQYQRFVQATGHRPSGYCTDARFSGAEHPVVGVSWDDAMAYAEWAGKRLPTEAEWEKAARGPDGRERPWGEDQGEADARLRCNAKGTEGGFEFTSPVDSFHAGASPYGCTDMVGDVWEWCADWYGENYYSTGPAASPAGPPGGVYRVIRGSCWDLDLRHARCANRGYGRPGARDNRVGFRCALDACATEVHSALDASPAPAWWTSGVAVEPGAAPGGSPISLTDAIELVLRRTGRHGLWASEIAAEIREQNLYRRGDGQPAPRKQVATRLRKNARRFEHLEDGRWRLREG